MNSSTGTSRRPFGPCDRDDGAGRDQRRNAVGRRRGVAEVAAGRGAALHLRRADQVDRLDHARPGACDSFACSPITAPETAAPMRKPPPGVSAIVVISAIFLTSTMMPGLARAGAHLHQQVGAAGKDEALAARGQHGLHGLIDGVGARYRMSLMSVSVALPVLCPPVNAGRDWSFRLAGAGHSAAWRGGRVNRIDAGRKGRGPCEWLASRRLSRPPPRRAGGSGA